MPGGRIARLNWLACIPLIQRKTRGAQKQLHHGDRGMDRHGPSFTRHKHHHASYMHVDAQQIQLRQFYAPCQSHSLQITILRNFSLHCTLALEPSSAPSAVRTAPTTLVNFPGSHHDLLTCLSPGHNPVTLNNTSCQNLFAPSGYYTNTSGTF